MADHVLVSPVATPTVTGSRGANAALASLLSGLASEGVLVDSSTAGNVPLSGGEYLGTTVLTAGTTFTTSANTTKIRVRMWGSGAGGGAADTAAVSACAGGGGGAGGYAEKVFTVTPSTGYTYAIGAGGAGGTGGGNGSDGNDTTFQVNATTVTARYGVGGGGGGVSAVAGSNYGGSASPNSVNGDVNGSGEPGCFGIHFSGTVGVSGAGGSSSVGGGGVGKNTAGTGNAASGYGAGGGGGLVLNGSSAVDGGAGSGGLIIVDEYA